MLVIAVAQAGTITNHAQPLRRRVHRPRPAETARYHILIHCGVTSRGISKRGREFSPLHHANQVTSSALRCAIESSIMEAGAPSPGRAAGSVHPRDVHLAPSIHVRPVLQETQTCIVSERKKSQENRKPAVKKNETKTEKASNFFPRY